ncbi:MAG: PQQ-binding-like beta-propeller repeat protein [Sedimentisphaerales bacterium]|nr:PQQ-binding-like beta-propeller repeat protein [Sedimentisphaerales bacterium]
MDNKLKTIVILSAIISLFLLIMIFQVLLSGPKYDLNDIVEIIPVTQNENNWPMFRGSQELLGIAQGQLPDSLEFLWRFKTDGGIKSSPVIDSNIVYVGSNDDNIYAIDLYTGDKVWSYKTDDSVEAPPLCINGMVYAGSLGGFFYAIDANSGEFKWKYETDGSIYGAANWTYSPDKKSIWIIVGSYDNFLYCFNFANGKLVWKYESDNFINGSTAIEDQTVVFGGCDEVIHAISLTNGNQIAKIEDVSNIAASAAILDGQVYVGNYNNVFLKADIKSEKILWEYTESDAPFFSSPAIGEDYIIVGSRDEHVHCIGRNDGKKIWTFTTLGEVDSSPVICGDKVIFGSEDGNIYMIRLSDGSQVWSYEIGQGVNSSPAVAQGMVVIGCDDGYVYAFGTK